MSKIKINISNGILEEIVELPVSNDYKYPGKSPGVHRTKLGIYQQPKIIFYKRINPQLKGKEVKVKETSLEGDLHTEIEQVLEYNGKKLIANVFKVNNF